MHSFFTPSGGRARSRTRAFGLAAVVALLLLLVPATAGVVLGHDATVAANATCSGAVNYTVTDWTTDDTTVPGQADATFTVSYAINGSSTYTTVTTTAHFSSADSWSWSGSFTPSTPYTSLSVKVSDFVWGDGGDYPGPWYGTATLPTSCQPSLSTIPSPSEGGQVGVTLTDTAMLSGAFNPGGSITFDLYGPNDSTCDADTPTFSQTVTVSGDGSYSTPAGFKTTASGTYYWSVSYSGDDSGNSSASAGCGEPVVVRPTTPVNPCTYLNPCTSPTPSPTPSATPSPTPTPALPTPTPTTPAPTPTGAVAGATGTPAPSVPPTSTVGTNGGTPGDSLPLLLGALAAASLALVVVTRLRGRILENIER
jgi:cell division septation protein DedD